jgi:exonuclease SbcC
MRPVCLRLKGFTSFKEETTVSFAHLDRFAVCGPTGAGKSSLFDALTFALFAHAPRIDTGKLVDLVSLGRTCFSVGLDFSIAGRTYRVTRSRSRSGTNPSDQLHEVGIVEPLATGTKAVTAAVEKMLGLSYDHFIQSVFLPQGKFAELLRSAPSVRRKLLNELLRLLIYERMREAAGQEREGSSARTQETQARLREDFAGVSTEALEELSRQLSAQQQIMADAGQQLPVLKLRWEEARCNHDWTTELDARQLDWAGRSARQPDIDLAQRELEAAVRAGEVLPLLEQADAAHKALAERQALLSEAGMQRSRCLAEHEKARAALERATTTAAPLPQLRDRLERLTLAVGKLPLQEKFVQEIKLQLGRHESLVSQKSKCAANLYHWTDAIASLDKTLRDAESELARIGYDLDRHRRLEAVREDAFRLRSDRDRFFAALRQAEQDEARAEQAESVAQRAAEEEAAAEKARQQAQRKFSEAERRLRAAEDAHKAIHLRAGLQAGQPCPVCLHKVGKLPADEPAPELEEKQRELEAIRVRLTKADAAAAELNIRLTSARAAAAAMLQQAQANRAEAAQRQHAVDALQRSLLEKVGDLFVGRTIALAGIAERHQMSGDFSYTFQPNDGHAGSDSPRRRKTGTGISAGRKKTHGPTVAEASPGLLERQLLEQQYEMSKIEEEILSSLQQSALQADKHRRAAERATGFRNDLALKHKEMETLQAESVRLEQDLQKTSQKLAQDRQALAQTQAEIHEAAGTGDPVTESDHVRQEIERRQHMHAVAVQAEAEANKNWQIADSRTSACAAEVEVAQTKVDAAERQANKVMSQAGFADAAAARRAGRTPQQQQALRDRIAEHTAELHTLSIRIAELEKLLNGRRVLRDECQQCEQAHSDCLQAKQQAQTQAALLAGQVEMMGRQLQRSQQLQTELARQQRQQQIYDQLARDLRSDNFQAFLLEETLAGLVRDASGQLLRLTGERYGLHFEEERIFVVDNDNAAEHRGIETLSGGETFLASLALALALSEQVQKIAGAVHLDCLFIDEGFGALDPETLRTVSDTIRALQVGGRMVGVITHVPELKEEFDQRILVERKEGTSQVRMEIC